MKKVNEKILERKLNKKYFEGAAFSGTAYLVSGCEVKVSNVYDNGIIISTSADEAVDSCSRNLHLVSDCLDHAGDNEKGPFYYKNKIFNGVGYEFDNGLLSGEFICKDGWIVYEAGYDDSGRLNFCECEDNDTVKSYSWFPDGSVKSIEIFKRNDYSFSYVFLDSGIVHKITIDNNYSSAFNEIIREGKIESSSIEPKNITMSSNVFISGQGIDDAFVERVLRKFNNELVNKINIYNTSLSMKSYEYIATIDSIRDIVIVDKRIDMQLIEGLFSNVENVSLTINGVVVR